MSLKNQRANRPSISVCLATYNGQQDVEKQVRSILPQLGVSDEIIVSDDGSTDKTINILKDLKDSRIRIVQNQLRKGPVGNFENALRESKGEVIFLCDQDDIWFDEKISKHLEEHMVNDLVISDAIVVDESQNVIYSSFFSQRKSKKGLLNNLLRNSYIGCCTSFNRKILDKALPFPSDIHMHDWWIGLIAEVSGKVTFLNEPLMYYRRHSNNASVTLMSKLPIKEQIVNRYTLIRRLFLRILN